MEEILNKCFDFNEIQKFQNTTIHLKYYCFDSFVQSCGAQK